MSVILTLFLSAVNSTCMLIIVNEQQHNQELFFKSFWRTEESCSSLSVCVCVPTLEGQFKKR